MLEFGLKDETNHLIDNSFTSLIMVFWKESYHSKQHCHLLSQLHCDFILFFYTGTYSYCCMHMPDDCHFLLLALKCGVASGPLLQNFNRTKSCGINSKQHIVKYSTHHNAQPTWTFCWLGTEPMIIFCTDIPIFSVGAKCDWLGGRAVFFWLYLFLFI